MTEKDLPSIDGKPLVRSKSKSTDRHKRETISKIAEQVQLSAPTLRRILYIKKYGSEQVQELCKNEKLSTWRAYNFVRQQQEGKLFRIIEETLEKRAGEQK